MLDPLLVPLGRLGRILGGQVLRPVRRPDSSRSSSGWWSGHCGRARARSPRAPPGTPLRARQRRLVAVDSTPSQPAQRTTQRQRQALADQRHQDDRERHAAGSGCAPGSPPAGRARRPATPPRAGPPSRRRTSAAGRAPGRRAPRPAAASPGSRLEAKTQTNRVDDHDRARRRPRARRSGRLCSAPSPSRMSGQRQADQHEHEAVEDEPDHLPGGQPQHPAARRQDRAQPAADDQARRSPPPARPRARAARPAGRRRTG